MRRFLPLAVIATLLLAACAPIVTLITLEPGSTPTAESSSGLVTATLAPTHAPSPSPRPGGQETPTLRINPQTASGVEVEAWVSGDVPGLGQLAADFNGSNPWGVKISIVFHPNLNLLGEAVSASLESDSHPDLVLALPEQLLGWSDALLNLSPYAAHPEFGVARDVILPVFWEQSSLDGAQYGLPVIRSARYLFYNVTWARELGFEAEPQTWDAFREQACAANAVWRGDSDPTNDGFGGLALEVTSNWQTPYAWIRALGGDVFGEAGFSFASEQNAAALEKLIDLRAEGCAWLPATPTNFEHLAARKAIFVTGGLGDLDDQRAVFSDSTDQWTVIAFPGETPVVPVYGLDMAVLKSDDASDLASWLFIQWLLKPENQARLAREGGLFPVSNAALDLLKSDYAANAQKGAAAGLLTQAIGYPQSAQWRLVNKILADGFVYLFQVFPTASAGAVLEQVDATAKDLGVGE